MDGHPAAASHRSEEGLFMEITRAVLEKDIQALKDRCKEAATGAKRNRLRELLLEDQERGRGKTLLEEAVCQDNYEMVITILETALPRASARPSARPAAATLSRKSVSKPRASYFRKNSGFLNEHRRLKDPGMNRDSALHWACFFGQVKTVCALLRYGYSPQEVDSVGNTALHLAVAGAKKCWEEGAEEAESISPHQLIVEMLISEPDVLRQSCYARNSYGNTPIDLAFTCKPLEQLLKKAIGWMQQDETQGITGLFSKNNLWRLTEQLKQHVDHFSTCDGRNPPAVEEVEQFRRAIEDARKCSLDVGEALESFNRVSAHAALLQEMDRLDTAEAPNDMSERRFMEPFTQLLKDAKRLGVSKGVIRQGSSLRQRRILASVLRSRLASYLRAPQNRPLLQESLQLCLTEALSSGLPLSDPFAYIAKNLLLRDCIEKQLEDESRKKLVEPTVESVTEALKALEEAFNGVKEHNERNLAFIHDSLVTPRVQAYFTSHNVDCSIEELQAMLHITPVDGVEDQMRQLRKQLSSKRGKRQHGKKPKSGGSSKKSTKDRQPTKKGKRKKKS